MDAQQVRDMIGFAVRTSAASILALYSAFALQLESPYWAALAVWISSQGTPGVTVTKSYYMVIGTVAGSFFGLALIALFAQTPELFVFSLALLAGGCTVLSNLLTNFRGYAGALTIITAGIVASSSINTPSDVFFIAMARMSCILLGIASSLAVTSIFAPHRAAQEAQTKLEAAFKSAAFRVAYPWRGANEVRLAVGRKLIQDLVGLLTSLNLFEEQLLAVIEIGGKSQFCSIEDRLIRSEPPHRR